jgi:hypothetical protein
MGNIHPTSLRSHDFAMEPLIPFELLPSNVIGMVVANRDHPGVGRLAVPFALSSPAIDYLGSRFRFAECQIGRAAAWRQAV